MAIIDVAMACMGMYIAICGNARMDQFLRAFKFSINAMFQFVAIRPTCS